MIEGVADRGGIFLVTTNMSGSMGAPTMTGKPGSTCRMSYGFAGGSFAQTGMKQIVPPC